jgi:hypothetical protein
MADGAVVKRPRARKRVTRTSNWREYEQRKAQFLRECAYPTPEAYEQFIFTLGKKLGL